MSAIPIVWTLAAVDLVLLAFVLWPMPRRVDREPIETDIPEGDEL